MAGRISIPIYEPEEDFVFLPIDFCLRALRRWYPGGLEEAELLGDAGADPRAPALLERARVPTDGIEGVALVLGRYVGQDSGPGRPGARILDSWGKLFPPYSPHQNRWESIPE